jgi:serine protease AprX
VRTSAKRLVLCLAAAGLVVLSCAPALGPGEGGNHSVTQANQSKLYGDLKDVLAGVGEKELVPVLIMANNMRDMQELDRMAPTMQIKYRYSVVPAVAASVTRSQVEELSRQYWVRHIEHDGEVRTMMDGASRWFGATKARLDYGVTGNLDGSAGFSRDDVVIAIIDTGIDPTHVDLDEGKVIAWRDWVNNRTTAYDDNGHGTHVAGIAAGTGEGNPAYKGVAPGAALVGLKVLDRFGSGSLSNVTAAIDWAVENRATYNIRIISMSNT